MAARAQLSALALADRSCPGSGSAYGCCLVASPQLTHDAVAGVELRQRRKAGGDSRGNRRQSRRIGWHLASGGGRVRDRRRRWSGWAQPAVGEEGREGQNDRTEEDRPRDAAGGFRLTYGRRMVELVVHASPFVGTPVVGDASRSAPAGRAQSGPTGSLSGTVTDQAGAVIPNATITVTNVATGAKRTITTDAEGFWKAPVLEVGTFKITIEATGFKSLTATDLLVEAAVPRTVEG